MPVIRRLFAILFLLCVAGELTACGKEGDLEVPPTKEETEKKRS